MTFSLKTLFLIPLIIFSCEINSDPSEEIQIDATLCFDQLSDTELDVVTWNLKTFPLTDETPEYLDDLIEQMDADIIAIQEISSPFALSGVLNKLENWEGKIYSMGDLKLGFLYKTTEVEISELTTYFNDDTYLFPRPVVGTVATHISTQEEIHIFNLHLKCCGGSESTKRRRNALVRLKAHLDGVHATDNVIVLGDFNDDIAEPSSDNVFSLFNSDTNWLFTDMTIAEGPQEDWSYPSYPGHLDHILINNELYDNLEETTVIKIEPCINNYPEVISDHRPVLSTFLFHQ